MSIKIALQNPATSETKLIKVGFSWTLFFFAPVLGIPLFARKLYLWGFAMLAINLAGVLFPLMESRSGGIATQLILLVGQVILMFKLGIKGNEMTAKHWLAKSWRFADPQSDATRYARMRWNIIDPTLPPPTLTTSAAP